MVVLLNIFQRILYIFLTFYLFHVLLLLELHEQYDLLAIKILFLLRKVLFLFPI